MTALSFLLWAAVGFATDPPPREQAAAVVRTYDVGLAAPRPVDQVLSEWLFPLNAAWEYQGQRGLGVSEPDTDFVAELIWMLFDEELQYEGTALELDGTRLTVVGPRALHDGVQRLLAFLEQQVRQPIGVRIDCVLSDDPAAFDTLVDASGSVALSARQAAELRSSSGVSSYRLALDPGGLAQVAELREESVLWNWIVEAAQGTAAHGPRFRVVTAGQRIAVHALPSADGIRLTLVRRSAEVGGRERLEVVTRSRIGQDNVQERNETLPFERLSLRNGSSALCTTQRPGEVFAFPSRWDLERGRGSELLLLEVEERRDYVAVFEAGAGRVLEVRTAPWALAALEGQGPRDIGGSLRGLEGHTTVSGVSPEFSLLTTLAPGASERDLQLVVPEGVDVAFRGAQCFFVRDASTPSPSIEHWESLAPPGGRITVDVRLVETGAERRELVRLALPASEGASSFGIVGYEGTIVSRADLTVAQHSRSASFSLEHVFDGLLVEVTPRQRADGGWSVDVAARARMLDGPPQRIELDAPVADALERIASRDLLVTERVEFAPGDAGPVVLGALAGEDALALEVSVR